VRKNLARLWDKLPTNRNCEHYLPTGQPCRLYNYPHDRVKDYGSVPDSDILKALEQQVSSYNLNQYLTESTQSQCHELLQARGYPPEFSFLDNHQEAYIFLRQAVSQYVEQGGANVVVLKLPIRAEEWITVQQSYKQEAREPPNEFRLHLTDDEKETAFEEDKIIDTDRMENDKELSEDFLNDGFILNILTL